MQRSERLASLRAESMLSIEPFFPKANFFLKRRKETVRPLSGGPQSGTFLSDAGDDEALQNLSNCDFLAQFV